jgi:hypothetical protein
MASPPPDLAAFLLLHAAVSARDEEITRQALRMVAEDMSTSAGHKVAGVLYRSISGGGRNWLSRLAG